MVMTEVQPLVSLKLKWPSGLTHLWTIHEICSVFVDYFFIYTLRLLQGSKENLNDKILWHLCLFTYSYSSCYIFIKCLYLVPLMITWEFGNKFPNGDWYLNLGLTFSFSLSWGYHCFIVRANINNMELYKCEKERIIFLFEKKTFWCW